MDVVRNVEASGMTPRLAFQATGRMAAQSAETGKILSASTRNGAGGTS